MFFVGRLLAGAFLSASELAAYGRLQFTLLKLRGHFLLLSGI